MKNKVWSHKRCNVCKTVIAITYQIDTGSIYDYKIENTPERYIDRWGYARNFCKMCMDKMRFL